MGKTKKLLVTAAVMVVLGLILFAAVMTAYRWDFTKLSTVAYETNTYEISEEFYSISMNTDTADILFAASPDGTCSVVCYEAEKARHSVDVRDGTLTIAVVDEREWYDYIGITIGSPKITVYLPEREYASVCIQESTGDVEIPKDFKLASMDISVSTGDVKNYASASGMIKIKTSTGDICVEGVTAGALDLSVSTGKVAVTGVSCQGDVTISVSTGKTEVTGVRCKNLLSNGNTGDIVLKDVIAAGKFTIARTTGDVQFDGCDAAELFLKTSTGDIEGTLLTEKVFLAKSDTGDVDVPDTIAGGRCEISTDTGDIEISILP